MKYVIDSKTYEKHINDEVHLYGLLHQLAFLAGKVKDDGDVAHLTYTAQHYGDIMVISNMLYLPIRYSNISEESWRLSEKYITKAMDSPLRKPKERMSK